MSSHIIKEELTSFLNSHEPGVFAVKGKWGVGKTHLVREVVSDNKSKWGDKKFAYVSLFGVNSLEELRERIFVEIESAKPGIKKGKEWFKALGNLADKTGTPIGSIGSGLIGLSTQLWMNNAIPRSKIVVDDIERLGVNLPIRDLLGFLSQLKEQNECQVVLIFNEGELEKATKSEVERYREKVFDREIAFVPDVSEVIRLGFPDATSTSKELLHRLGVDNIRAVQKVRQFTIRLEPYVKNLSKGARKEVLRPAIILAWFYFIRDRTSIPWSFIKKYDGDSWLIVEKALGHKRNANEAETEEDKIKESQTLRLRETGYETTGPLETLLINALETGFHEPDTFNEILQELSEKVRLNEARAFLTEQVWSIYHSSFDDTQQEFADAMVACFEKEGKYLGLHSLSEAVSVMERLGQEKVAERLCDIFFSIHTTFDPSATYFELRPVENERVIARVKALSAQTSQDLQTIDMRHIIHEIIRNSGWNPSDIDTLNMYSEDDWYRFFKEDLRGEEFKFSYIKRLLEFGTYEEEKYKSISEKAEAALRKIASESLINKVRIEGFGIRLG